jgi:hypothetical protein
VEDHDRSLLGLQAPEAALELIAIREQFHAVLGRGFGMNHSNLGRQPPLVPPLVGAGIDDEPVEPGVETIQVAETAKLPPCMHEGFLDCVLGLLAITQDEERDREETVANAGREDLEGLVIAVSRRFHDISLH